MTTLFTILGVATVSYWITRAIARLDGEAW